MMKKKQKVFLVDVDGVLADFTGALLNACGSKLKTSDINDWDMFSMIEPDARKKAFEVLKTKEFWRNLPLLPNAQNEIEKLRRKGRVLFVTSPWGNPTAGWECDGWGYARAHWLREHFNAIPADIIITYSKGFVSGDVLIDDRFKNIQEWAEMNPKGKAFLVRCSHNHKDHWDKVVTPNENEWNFSEKV